VLTLEAAVEIIVVETKVAAVIEVGGISSVVQYSGFDIIGDIHGCALSLEALLKRLGYRSDSRGAGGKAFEDKVYYHPSRQAVFTGDIIDRGARIREALHLVKNMVDTGSAHCVMGNHEYNALAYTTETLDSAQYELPQYVREHNLQYQQQISSTLRQFEGHEQQWLLFLKWMYSLPAFLELDGFRVVHACWDEALIERFKTDKRVIDRQWIQETADQNSFAAHFMNRLTRGTGIQLPDGRHIDSSDGRKRRFFRTKFWSSNPQILQDVVYQPDPLPEDLAVTSLSQKQKQSLLHYDETAVPVFFGHYWLSGQPSVQSTNVACLDYSAVKNGRLAAYRFDGECKLDANKIVWVDASIEYGSGL